MLYVTLALGLLFIGIAFTITEENAESLLSGYNTMSQEDREKFPLKEYLEAFKRFHIRFGILYGLLGLAFYFIKATLLGLHLAITPILAYIYFFIQTRHFSADLLSQKKNFKISITVLVGTLLFVIAMFFWSEKTSELTVNKDSLGISGPYGTSIRFDEIDSLALLETLPEITTRRHGISTGSVAKGKYRGPEGDYLLLIDKPYDTILWIGRKGKVPVLLALNNLDEEKVYRELKETLELDAP